MSHLNREEQSHSAFLLKWHFSSKNSFFKQILLTSCAQSHPASSGEQVLLAPCPLHVPNLLWWHLSHLLLFSLTQLQPLPALQIHQKSQQSKKYPQLKRQSWQWDPPSTSSPSHRPRDPCYETLIHLSQGQPQLSQNCHKRQNPLLLFTSPEGVSNAPPSSHPQENTSLPIRARFFILKASWGKNVLLCHTTLSGSSFWEDATWLVREQS